MLYIICLLIFVLTAYYTKKVLKIRGFSKKLIYFQIIYNCFIKFLQGYLGLPSILSYVTDILLLLIVINYLIIRRKRKKSNIPKSLKIVFITYFSVTILTYIFNLYNPLLYFWGFRNNMRFIIFSMMCVVYLDIEDINRIMSILFGYFLLNIPVITYEYFLAGLDFRTGDIISGLYSIKTKQGGNGELNWLICIISTYAIVQYLNKTKKIYYLLICIISSCYMAALSELKVFFVEIIIIAIVAIWLSKKSVKILIFTIIGIIALIIGINLLYTYFPKFNNFFDLKNINQVLFSTESYSNRGGMSRFGAIAYVFENFSQTTLKKLLGIGFGNADYSTFSFLTSDFYIANKNSSYQWFYGPFILIETGIIGLVSYVFILINFIKESFSLKNFNIKILNFKIFSIIISLLSIMMLFYNQSMKTETAGYMVFLMLSIPYIIKKTSKYNNNF